MGGGMMGGGMRSIPPTSLPHATFKPGQTRELPTPIVSLTPPDPTLPGGLNLPAKGERLRITDVSQTTQNKRLQKALKRLAVVKAPQTVAQLVLWKLSSEADWDTIAGASQPWANAYELSLAEHFVESLDTLPDRETGVLRFEFVASRDADPTTVADVKRFFKDRLVLGLKTVEGIPATPSEPAIACRVKIGKSEASVQTLATNANTSDWLPCGKFTLTLSRESGKIVIDRFADALTEGILNRFVRAQLVRGSKSSGKSSYTLRIDNASPLVLNGVGVKGNEPDTAEAAPMRELAGICISPRHSLKVPVSDKVVRLLELKKGAGGVRVVAVDLSGL
jgi:hypothetical protein